MSESFCLPHSNRGFPEVLASRVIAGTPMCDGCVAGVPIQTELDQERAKLDTAIAAIEALAE